MFDLSLDFLICRIWAPVIRLMGLAEIKKVNEYEYLEQFLEHL